MSEHPDLSKETTPPPDNSSSGKQNNYDYWDYRTEMESNPCPRCGSDQIVWEEEDASYYCEGCHNFI